MGDVLNAQQSDLELPTSYEEVTRKIGEAVAFNSLNCDKYRFNTRFVMLGQQWAGYEYGVRTPKGKATLTFNLIKTFINQIVGEYRKYIPGLVIRGKNEGFEETAQIVNGLQRQIFYESKIATILQQALRRTMVGGFSVIEVNREYDNPRSFLQKISLKGDTDPTAYYFAPDAVDATKSSADYCGEIIWTTKSKLMRTFKNIENAQSFPISNLPATSTQQSRSDQIALCHHFEKVYKENKIAQLSNGMVVDASEAKSKIIELNAAQEFMIYTGMLQEKEEITVLEERDTVDFDIYEYYLLDNKVIDSSVLPGKNMPRIFVDGDSVYDDGQQITVGFADLAMDQQRLLNYVRSQLASFLLTSSTTQWIGTKENFRGHEMAWRRKDQGEPYLTANPDPLTGKFPEKFDATPFPPALLGLDDQLVRNVRELMGHYQAMDGAGGTDESGVALNTKIKQGNNASNVFIDNINVALEQVGRVCIGMMPHVYDTTRELTIRDKDDKPKTITINEPAANGSYLNEIKIDDYSVTVEAAGNFEAQRMEELKLLLQYIPNDPALMSVCRDLLVKRFNLEDKEEFVERARMVLPPEIKAQLDGEELPPPPPNPEVQVESMKAQVEMEKQKTERMNIALEQEKINTEREKLGLGVRNALLQQKTTDTKAFAEITKASLALQQAHVTHQTKMHEHKKKLDGLLMQPKNAFLH